MNRAVYLELFYSFGLSSEDAPFFFASLAARRASFAAFLASRLARRRSARSGFFRARRRIRAMRSAAAAHSGTSQGRLVTNHRNSSLKNSANRSELPARKSSRGISEVTDSLTIIVSEETGNISLAFKGKLDRNVSQKQLRDRLTQLQNKAVLSKKAVFRKEKVKNGS